MAEVNKKNWKLGLALNPPKLEIVVLILATNVESIKLIS